MRVEEFDDDAVLLTRFLAFRAGAGWQLPLDASAARLLGAGPSDWPRSHGARWRNFLAIGAGEQVQGRLTAIVNPAFAAGDGRPFGQLGFVEWVDDEPVARALTDAALGWLGRQSGVHTVLAPMDFDAWHAYRLRTYGHELTPFAGEPEQPAYYARLLAACGFGPVSEHVTKTIDDPAAAVADWSRFHERAEAQGVCFVAADLDQLDEALGRVLRLSPALFGDLNYYTPLPEAEFRALYADVGRLLEPDGLLFAVAADGQDLGFSFSFRQPGQPRDVYLKTFGVLPAWRGRGLAPALSGEVYRRWLGHGVQRVHHCLMAAGDASARFDRGAGVVTRRYELFARALQQRSA